MGAHLTTLEEPRTHEADFLTALRPAVPPVPPLPATADDEGEGETNFHAHCRISARYRM